MGKKRRCERERKKKKGTKKREKKTNHNQNNLYTSIRVAKKGVEKAKEKGRRDRETLLKGWRKGGASRGKPKTGRRDEKGGWRRVFSHWESEKREKKGFSLQGRLKKGGGG